MEEKGSSRRGIDGRGVLLGILKGCFRCKRHEKENCKKSQCILLSGMKKERAGRKRERSRRKLHEVLKGLVGPLETEKRKAEEELIY